MKLVQAWIEIHKDDLMANWELASQGQTVFQIEPLNRNDSTMNPRVKEVKPNPDYTLTITFTNGEVKIFDVKFMLLGFQNKVSLSR